MHVQGCVIVNRGRQRIIYCMVYVSLDHPESLMHAELNADQAAAAQMLPRYIFNQ